MIEEVLIKTGYNGNTRVIVYPKRSEYKNARRHESVTLSSRKRLQRMTDKYNVQIIIGSDGPAVWLDRR